MIKYPVIVIAILFLASACQHSADRYYELSLKENTADPSAYDLYIKEEGASERVLKTISGVKKLADGNHFAIVGKGVFILKSSNGEANNTWHDELWYFTADQEVLIQSEHDAELVFSLSPDNGQILVISKNGKLMIGQTAKPEEPFKDWVVFTRSADIDLTQFEAWASNGEEVWLSGLKVVSSSVSTVPTSFYKVNIVDGKITHFDMPHKRMNDVKLNPYSEELVYSDYPVLTDEESYSTAVVSENYAKLYLYDLNTKTTTVIDSMQMIEGLFEPVWLEDEVTLEYNGGSEQGRVQVNFENYLLEENQSVGVVGAWHASPSVGAGYSERYLFMQDNKYLFFTNQEDETQGKIIVEMGSWSLQGNLIVLKTVRKITNENSIVVATEERTLAISDAEEELPDASPYLVKRKINGVYFWQYSEGDEAAWKSEFEEISGDAL
jgi:hypothetical protein